jgi:serine/threonine protein kinase
MQNNVLIAADGSPRIADFGISNIVMLSNAAFSHHAGAVRWTAPEIVVIPEDQTIIQYGTKSSDIYALGGIMLQVLSLSLACWLALTDATCRSYMGNSPIGGLEVLYTLFLRSSEAWNLSGPPSRSSQIT